jgi:hypothetical protein
MNQFLCCCFSSAAYKAKIKENALRMEQERKEGQALLRSMALGSNNKVDWQAIIKKAEELHHREQEWLQQQDSRQRRHFVQAQRRALQKRRKYDSIGNFSINMLTYRMEAVKKEESKPHESVTSSVGSTKEDADEEVSSVSTHGGHVSKSEIVEVRDSAPFSSLTRSTVQKLGLAPDQFVMCPSSSSSFMEFIEDQGSPDSDSI